MRVGAEGQPLRNRGVWEPTLGMAGTAWSVQEEIHQTAPHRTPPGCPGRPESSAPQEKSAASILTVHLGEPRPRQSVRRADVKQLGGRARAAPLSSSACAFLSLGHMWPHPLSLVSQAFLIANPSSASAWMTPPQAVALPLLCLLHNSSYCPSLAVRVCTPICHCALWDRGGAWLWRFGTNEAKLVPIFSGQGWAWRQAGFLRPWSGLTSWPILCLLQPSGT